MQAALTGVTTGSRLSGLRIGMATTGHPPDDDRIFFKEARSLARAGADVTILYAVGKDPPAETDGVRFRRYATARGWGRRLDAVGRLVSALANERYDVIHCHEPEAMAAALWHKRRTGVKVIFDSHELWAGSLAQRFPERLWSPTMALYSAVERRLIARCDAAIGASWAISDYLAQQLGAERVATILNVPVVEVFGEHPGRTWGARTILCHDGHLTFNRGLKTMARAVQIVARTHDVQLRIVGEVFGKERLWLDEFRRAHGLEQVIVQTGWLPYREVGQALASCHIGLIALQKTPNNIVTSSNKVFNYMLYGIPFVGPSFRLAKRKLVAEERCGVLADSHDPASYAAAIEGLIANRSATEQMSARALQASKTKYRWEHMEGRLSDLYDRILQREG